MKPLKNTIYEFIGTVDSILDTVFASIYGVLSKLARSYESIASKIKHVYESLSDLNNVVQTNETGTTIMIRMSSLHMIVFYLYQLSIINFSAQDSFAYAFGKAVGEILKAYSAISNRAMVLDSEIVYLDKTLMNYFKIQKIIQ